MNDKYQVLPGKIARGRKIQVRQFEPEELWIEYNIEVSDPNFADEAVNIATQKAVSYLDQEEEKLRKRDTNYELDITEEGNKLGNFRIKVSEDQSFANFIHLWFQRSDTAELYIGYLHKKTGEFTLKKENIDKVNQIGIKQDIHFTIVNL